MVANSLTGTIEYRVNVQCLDVLNFQAASGTVAKSTVLQNDSRLSTLPTSPAQSSSSLGQQREHSRRERRDRRRLRGLGAVAPQHGPFGADRSSVRFCRRSRDRRRSSRVERWRTGARVDGRWRRRERGTDGGRTRVGGAPVARLGRREGGWACVAGRRESGSAVGDCEGRLARSRWWAAVPGLWQPGRCVSVRWRGRRREGSRARGRERRTGGEGCEQLLDLARLLQAVFDGLRQG